jgi:uncharacterized membrane protein
MERGRSILRVLLALFYGLAGVMHLIRPEPFLKITPAWVPWPDAVILITGVCEIAGAVGLFAPRWRRAAGIGLALYAVCVFPANIKHAIDDLSAGTGLPLGYHAPRLMLQLPIIWWALFASGVTNWPLGRRSAPEGAGDETPDQP